MGDMRCGIQGLSNVNSGLNSGAMQQLGNYNSSATTLGNYNHNPQNGPAAGPFANSTNHAMMNHNSNGNSTAGMSAGNGPAGPRNGNLPTNQHAPPNHAAFGTVGNSFGAASAPSVNGSSSQARGRSNQVSSSHSRSRVVSVEAKPFVPSLGRQVRALEGSSMRAMRI